MSVFSTKEQESNLSLSLNNDIMRIAQLLNGSQEVKKLIYYIEKNPLSQPDVRMSLIDKTILRVPLIVMDNETEKDASYISINLLMSAVDGEMGTGETTIAIDVWVPPEQWLTDDGLRPLIICHYVDKLMRTKFVQTSGVRYRLDKIINAKLSDRLMGYRMVYETILEL